ncbi:MAG: hypothetical protein R6V28_11460 [Nitriliruptoraceae bacterium]
MDQPDELPREPESAWLAAFALGLAYSSKSHRERLDLLAEATQGRPELLAMARRRLETAEVMEPELRDQARRLLDRAMTVRTTGATMVAVNGA